MVMAGSEEYAQLKTKWASYGQDHVFRFAERNMLSSEELKSFIEQVKTIDLQQLADSYKSAKEASSAITSKSLTPFPEVRKSNDTEHRNDWYQTGLEEVGAGRVACVLLAGGQGTRLSATDPKGMYDILLPSHKTLFQIQAERILKVQELSSKLVGKDKDTISIPWYILTSKATHRATVDFFEQNSFFGLKKENVFFFSQGSLPCITPEGKILLESAGVIAEAPNGNGGFYSALHSSGAIADMDKRGVKTIFCYGVDNVLVRVADPSFIGCFVQGKYDCGAKVVPKAHPEEPVGVLCLSEGKPVVVEYSEIGTDLARKVDEHNNLVYNQGNICIHIYDIEFMKRIGVNKDTQLPYHIAVKKIPYANEETGEKTAALQNNGWKLETFIFDAFPYCSKMLAFEVVRDEEFSPLKNAQGADSPDSCRFLITKLHRKWIEEAGGKFSSPLPASFAALTPDDIVEVSPLVSYAGEGLEKVAGKTFSTPLQLNE